MFNVGPMELMVLLVMALIVFGPAKLPELMGSVGRAIREFQRASQELTDVFQETQQEFSSAFEMDQTGTVATAAPEPATNGAATTELSTTVPVVEAAPPAVVPDEYETAAAMVDPVEPFPASAVPESPPPGTPTEIVPDELGTTAGLVDAAPVAVAEPAPTKPKRTRARRKTADDPTSSGDAENDGGAKNDGGAGAEPPNPSPEQLESPVPVAPVAPPTSPLVATNGARPGRRRKSAPVAVAEEAD